MPDSSLSEPSTMTRSNGRATTSASSASANPEMVAALNFVLQDKGGFGKTFAASLLAPYYLEQGVPPVCLDTNPVNGSFSAIRALGARHVGLLTGDRIDVEVLDELVQQVLTQDAQPETCRRGCSSRDGDHGASIANRVEASANRWR
jgi:hypothetical protein